MLFQRFETQGRRFKNYDDDDDDDVSSAVNTHGFVWKFLYTI